MRYLNNKTVVITGGTDGLGREIARLCHEYGVKTIITGRDKTKLDKVCKELSGIEGLMLELSNHESFEAFVSVIFQKSDDVVWINNAAMWLEGATGDEMPSQVEQLVDVNLTAQMLLSRYVVLNMKKQKRGHIVFTNSVAGIDLSPGYSYYSATKFGLKGFAESLKYELKDENVKVSSIHPGGMHTGLFEKAGHQYGKAEWMMDPEHVAGLLLTMIDQPDNVLVDEIVVRNFPHNLGSI
jgi:3-oxoacyl-[acyl-carrier protein] reductase